MLNSKFSLQARIFATVAKIPALQTAPFFVFLLSTLIVIVLVRLVW